LDEVIASFATCLQLQQQQKLEQKQSSLVELFTQVNPTCEPLFEIWPDVHHLQQITSWKNRESIGFFMRSFGI
jgi:hypothetical protein